MDPIRLVVITFLSILCQVSTIQAKVGFGILEARAVGETGTVSRLSVCIAYNSEYQKLPPNVREAEPHHLVDLSSVLGCSAQDFSNPPAPLDNSTVAVMRGNCSFIQKAHMVQSYNGSAVVVVDHEDSPHPTYPGGNSSEFETLNISLVTIAYEDYKSVINLSKSVHVLIYVPSSPLWDPNMILIILLPTLLVVIGALWSAFGEWQHRKGSRRRPSKSHDSSQDNDGEVEVQEDAAEISTWVVLIWFAFICAMLVLLYFFYDYMVYFFIAMFCIAGSYSLYQCLLPVWSHLLPVTYDIPVNRLPCIRSKVKLRSLLLLMPCLTIGIFWAIERHAQYAWTLQDLLGAAFCISFIHALRLPNLKVIAQLLILLLVYDVFFVFISPLFTSDGHSIMEAVATGGRGKSKESLPMVFLLPTLSDSEIRKCTGHEYSLLGFGDVIIPGLLVAYNAVFDVNTGNSMVYFVCSSVGYFVGMIVCIISLVFMNSGQPALLYLVPGTLFTTVAVALIRKELRKLFLGLHNQKLKVDDSREPKVREHDEVDMHNDEEQRNLIN